MLCCVICRGTCQSACVHDVNKIISGTCALLVTAVYAQFQVHMQQKHVLLVLCLRNMRTRHYFDNVGMHLKVQFYIAWKHLQITPVLMHRDSPECVLMQRFNTRNQDMY